VTGVLYVVGTPIGNLGDITRRAVEILAAVDRIIAEDTRRTLRLLTHLGIKGKPLQCVEAHTDASRVSRIVELLLEGQNFALVTDAGMPGISDPGARLVSAATSAGVSVQVVPGPSAVTAALALSGLVEGPFYFFGFLPRQGKGRLTAIKHLVNCPDAVVIFESPYRIAATLEELAHHQPTRPAVLCRELTKLYEEVRRGTLTSLASEVGETRGEFVLVLGATRVEELSEFDASEITDETLLAKLAEGQSPRSVLEELGLKGKARRELYSRLLALANQHQEEV
jgi:16S rRNA (cytidine1402-2'-O)-methyltransferase